jgi:hypothetical protein
MKKLLFLSIFLIIGLFSYAQTRFQATHLNLKMYNDTTQQMSEWMGWKQTDIIITVSDTVINIYSNYEQKYLPIGDKNMMHFKDGYTIQFDALDVNTSRCSIELVHWNRGIDQIYIRWSNVQLAYQMKKL